LGPDVGKPDVVDNIVGTADGSLGIMVGPGVMGSGPGLLLGSGIVPGIHSEVGSNTKLILASLELGHQRWLS